jgi:hypothetical protein
MKLSPAQQSLLLQMHQASPTKVHSVNELGFKCSVLQALARQGLVEHATVRGQGIPDHWRGKLTPEGRKKAKELAAQ